MASSSPTSAPQPSNQRRRWPRIVGWAVIGICIAIVAVLAIAAILLHNPRFHRYLLAIAESKASSAIGNPVRIGNFAIHLSNLSVDAHDVTVLGAKPFQEPPLLFIPHLEASLKSVSIVERKWYLNTIRIDRPVVRILIDANGVSNLPKPESSNPTAQVNLFTLGIRHAVLAGGEIYYNNQKQSLNAKLSDVQFQASYHPARKEYSGSLSYSNGRVQFGDFRPISHGLDAQFTATAATFHLVRATLTSGSSKLLLSATLSNYTHPTIHGNYRAILNGTELQQILRKSSVPSGIFQTSGTVQYIDNAAIPALERIAVTGTITGNQATIRNRQIYVPYVPVRDFAADYSLQNGDLTVDRIRARLLDGTLSGKLAMQDISGNTRSTLTASLLGISLGRIHEIMPKSDTFEKLPVRGIADAKATAKWGNTFRNAVINVNAIVHASTSIPGSLNTSLPMDGSMRGTYRAASQQLALQPSYLQTPNSRLTVNGTLGRRSALTFHFQSSNLSELETVAELVQARHSSSAQSFGLGGTASFQGAIRGRIAAPTVSGDFSGSNLRFKGTEWRSIHGGIEASPSIAVIRNAGLDAQSGGHIAVNGQVQLSHWTFTKSSRFHASIQAAQIKIQELTKLMGIHRPLTGTVAANLHVQGTGINPSGQGSISITNASAYSQPISSAHLSVIGTGNQIRGQLDFHALHGTAQSKFAIRLPEKAYAIQIEAHGIRLDQLRLLQAHNINVHGKLDLAGEGLGTLSNPQFNARLSIPQLEFERQRLQNLQLNLALMDHLAIANFISSALGTSIQAQAKVDLSGNYMTQATLDTSNIPLRPLFVIYAPTEASDLHGETEIHAILHGLLKRPRQIEAQITIPVLKLGYSNTIQLAATTPVHVNYKNGVLDVQRTAIQGTDTNLQVQAGIPIQSRAPASLLMQGTVNLQLAQLFNPNIQSSGELLLDINSYGATSSPNVEGKVQIVNASFTNANLPLGLSRGNGVLVLTRDRLNIQSFSASMGGGTLTARGGVVYRPSFQFDLALAANGVRILYPRGLREEIGANLRFSGTRESSLLAGRVQIDNMSFTPDFDLASFAGQISGGVSAPPSQGFAQTMNLNIAVNSTNNLNLVSRTLSIDGTANLQLRGTAAQPVILGRINLTDGDVIFNGNRFTVNGGTIEFVNPSQTEPVLNIALNTTIQQYNIHLRFDGPVEQLRTNYSSDPSLPSADIINLLAFGNTTEYSAANPTPGDQAAISAVASQVSSQITSRVAKAAGISQLSINPVLSGGSAQGPAGAIVTIQQRVTGNLFVTFSTNVTSTQNQVIMGQYRLSPRVSVSVTRDQNGGVALDTTFKKKW